MGESNPAGERWAAVPGYEGIYEVSDLGRVRSLTRSVFNNRGWHEKPGRILKQTMGGNTRTSPRWKVGLSRDGRQRQWPVHVLVLTAFVGPRPPGMHACHENGAALDNRLANLRWDTPKANAADKVGHGTARWQTQERCLRGHAFIGANVRWTNNERLCVACSRGHSRVNNAWNRHGVRLDLQTMADWYYAQLVPTDAA